MTTSSYRLSEFRLSSSLIRTLHVLSTTEGDIYKTTYFGLYNNNTVEWLRRYPLNLKLSVTYYMSHYEWPKD